MKKLNISLLVVVLFFACKKEETPIQNASVLYEVAGNNFYKVSYKNEQGNWVTKDSATTGWRYQALFTDKIMPGISIERIGDTTEVEISFLRLYYKGVKYEHIDTSKSNKHSLIL